MTGGISQDPVIKVLYTERCGNFPHALAAVERAVQALGIDADVRSVLISDEATAVAEGFRGSPTVTVDGADIEPETQIEPGLAG